jgi:two-component system sensor histidine kinase HydH
MLNLYLNAIQAMKDGGQLTIIAEQESSGIRLQIRDTGSGILTEAQAHIFDPYFTTKASGTGLGLAIAHNIITAHQGRISVDSQPGQGTTVTIMLPLVDSAGAGDDHD